MSEQKTQTTAQSLKGQYQVMGGTQSIPILTELLPVPIICRQNSEDHLGWRLQNNSSIRAEIVMG